MVKVKMVSQCHGCLVCHLVVRPVPSSRKIPAPWELRRIKPDCAHTDGAFGSAHRVPSVSSLVSFTLSICAPRRHELFLSLPFFSG